MDKRLLRYESYARGVKRLLLVGGLWPPRVLSRLFQLLILVYFVSSMITAGGIMYFSLNHIKNLAIATKGLGIAVGFYTIILKIVVFTTYRVQLVELHEVLGRTFRKDLEVPEYRNILLSPIEYFYRPTIWLTTSTYAIITMYNVVPVVSFVLQLVRGVEVFQRRTLFPSQYPLMGNDFFFAVWYLNEVSASMAIGSVTSGTDALFGFYIFQLTSQFRVLTHRVANLTVSDDHYGIIKECVKRRQILAECCIKLQTIYGPIIIWMLTTSAIIMCANIFQASQISPGRAAIFFFYIAMKLMQSLLYGWYGLFLTTESEAFGDSIYLSGWPDFADKSILSNILIMMMGRPIALRACHISTVSLDMFMMIVNTTVSYFFLLRTLDEK